MDGMADELAERVIYDEPTRQIKQVQLAPGTYIEAIRDTSYRGWVIGQWNDNPYMVRVAWEVPVERIDIGLYDDIRPATRATAPNAKSAHK